MTARFAIDRLGAKGEGIAETGTGQVFIPFTLPGETVTAAREKDRATLMAASKRPWRTMLMRGARRRLPHRSAGFQQRHSHR